MTKRPRKPKLRLATDNGIAIPEAIVEWAKQVDLGLYILSDDHVPVKVSDLTLWAKWRAAAGEEGVRVGFDCVGTADISTVFLGVDHRFFGDGPPLLFETMIFNGPGDLDRAQWRWSTWDEAAAGHADAVMLCRKTG